jgi:3'(2'), 5'-bisphosphate nucleotidase
MDPAVLIAPVTEISRKAGAAIMAIYSAEDFGVEHKADDSPLTRADLASHRSITAELQALTPDITVLSEESASVPWSIRQQWQRYWLVDPLDGTKEFIKRNGEFTVNIALVENGVPVLGIVYVPVKEVLYGGCRGAGAWKVANGTRQEITTRPVVAGQRSLRVVASRSHRGEELDLWLQRVQARFPDLELVSMGSSLKICLVAEGAADIYPRLALTSEWDTAAAQAVLEAAGGVLVDTGFSEYRYNTKENILNPFFFAIGDPGCKYQDI